MLNRVAFLALLAGGATHPSAGSVRQADPLTVTVDWDSLIIQSKTTTTLQSVVNPLLLANSSIHGNMLDSLGLVSADYARFVPWFPYPILSVPEIDAPVMTNESCSTSWDFTYSDQMLGDFLNSTSGKKHIINYSTSPDWMWISDSPYSYPEDVNVIDFSYNNGTQLRDPSFKEIGDYYARLVSWYTKGGFTDECGVYHQSGYEWPIEFWEVLNEVDSEHTMTPEYYNQIYDAITSSIHAVNPDIQFVGLALATRNATWVESFLTPSNHQANTPLDWISYHFYGSPTAGDPEPSQAAEVFQQADQFFTEVQQIEAVRKSISPDTKTTLDEVGTIDPLGATTITPNYTIPPEYYVWSGGMYAYVFSNVAAMGIDVVGESQLVGYPGQYPSVSMVDWETGEPNARLRILQLLQTSFAPGDGLYNTTSSDEGTFHAQAFAASNGTQGRRLLVVNKSSNNLSIAVPDFDGSAAATVDVSTGGGAWRNETVVGGVAGLPAYGVMVLSQQE